MNSAELMAQAATYTPGGVHTSLRVMEPPICLKRGSGAYVEDVSGRRYLDYHAAFGPFILGHCYPAVVNRVTEALQQTDLYGLGTTELEVALSVKINQHVPSAEQVLLCNSGSEATQHAVRVSRAVTGRRKLLKFQGCFHGANDYLLRNVISPAERVNGRDPLSAGLLDEVVDNTLVCRFNDLADVERKVVENPEQIAAIILEPIPHNVGAILPTLEFLQGLRTLCDREGIVLIFDEVVTGFRHGLGGYQAICGVIPDLTTMGKAMANGFPIAALAGKRAIMERFNTKPGGDVFFSGTYNGHAVGVAAALATIEEMETKPVHEHVFALGERMRTGLRSLATAHQIPVVVTGFGSVYVMYFMEGPIVSFEDLLRNDVERFVGYRRALLDADIFELPMNLKRNHISFSHTEADIDRTLEAADSALAAIANQRVSA